LIEYAGKLAALLHRQNPQVEIWLVATWSRADQVYPDQGHWHGRRIEAMATDIEQACYQAKAGSPYLRGVVEVGAAWNRAFRAGVADPNPYDGLVPGQVDLWTDDHYHASAFGYYLEALMVFGKTTGINPLSLGREEAAASELGFTPEQTVALQRIASETLSAKRDLQPNPQAAKN
ncbi:MAG: hypothetical protein WCQ44_01985, partial [Opitutaceae bacterium]